MAFQTWFGLAEAQAKIHVNNHTKIAMYQRIFTNITFVVLLHSRVHVGQ